MRSSCRLCIRRDTWSSGGCGKATWSLLRGKKKMSIRVSHRAGNAAPQSNSPTTARLVKIAGNPAGIKIAVGGGVHLHRQVGKVGHG